MSIDLTQVQAALTDAASAFDAAQGASTTKQQTAADLINARSADDHAAADLDAKKQQVKVKLQALKDLEDQLFQVDQPGIPPSPPPAA